MEEREERSRLEVVLVPLLGKGAGALLGHSWCSPSQSFSRQSCIWIG